LISGIATAIKELRPDVLVIGVEPDLAGDLAEGFAAGERVAWDVEAVGRTIADGLRVPEVGVLPWQHIRRYVDAVVTVTEEEIKSAMRELAYREHLVVEAAGAVSYAAARTYTDRWAGRSVACVLSGGNVDPALFAEVVGVAGVTGFEEVVRL
jgi:threonine dehydratase